MTPGFFQHRYGDRTAAGIPVQLHFPAQHFQMGIAEVIPFPEFVIIAEGRICILPEIKVRCLLYRQFRNFQRDRTGIRTAVIVCEYDLSRIGIGIGIAGYVYLQHQQHLSVQAECITG